jgi:hypothetical protein
MISYPQLFKSAYKTFNACPKQNGSLARREGEGAMRTVVEYQHNADECRVLARQMTKPEDKTVLEQMAQMWEKLAKQREREVEPEAQH